MAVIRLILLVIVLGVLTLLLAQNWSPTLPLVFLGIQTKALPLAIWILLSVIAGAFSSLFLAGLLNLVNYFQPKQQQTQTSSPSRFTSSRNKSPRPQEPINTTVPPSNNDWETSSTNDDWDFNQPQESVRGSRPENGSSKDFGTYEHQQEPKTSYQSGSVYSYGYREPKNSGVGKSESVYDADFRVIVPPHSASVNKEATKDDEWEFLDEED